MSGHAPGPWAVSVTSLNNNPMGSTETLTGASQYSADYVAVVAADGTVICDNGEFYAKEIDPANARLIAAAPELLEALKHVAGYAMAGGKTFVDLPIVKAALAKAEGRQP